MLQAKDFFSSFAPRNTEVAQLVEYRSPKPAVGGSSPSFRARYKSRGFKSLLFLFLMVIAKIIKIGIYALWGTLSVFETDPLFYSFSDKNRKNPAN